MFYKSKDRTITYTVYLINLLTQNLIEKNLLSPQKKLFLSISTGQDSSFLFLFFLILKTQWHLSYGIIWFNHLWQKDSFYTFFQIMHYCLIWNNPIYICLSPYQFYTEKESRTWRDDCNKRFNNFYNYNFIVNGHTGTDRIETLFFQLIRGMGSSGLHCLAWNKTKTIKYPSEIHISIFQSIKFFTLFKLQNKHRLYNVRRPICHYKQCFYKNRITTHISYNWKKFSNVLICQDSLGDGNYNSITSKKNILVGRVYINIYIKN